MSILVGLSTLETHHGTRQLRDLTGLSFESLKEHVKGFSADTAVQELSQHAALGEAVLQLRYCTSRHLLHRGSVHTG